MITHIDEEEFNQHQRGSLIGQELGNSSIRG